LLDNPLRSLLKSKSLPYFVSNYFWSLKSLFIY